MIFSESRRFVFFAIPKTGTHAVREVLRQHLQAGDWEQQVRYGQQLSPLADIAAINHGHVSVQQLSAVVPREVLAGLFKFAVVRHPFERFVSGCAFLARTDPSYEQDPTTWMKRALERPRFRQRVLIATQYSLLAHPSGELGVDFVGRYESLQASFDSVCDQLSLPRTVLPFKNTSSHRSYEDVLDGPLRAQLEERYAQDFSVFHYHP